MRASNVCVSWSGWAPRRVPLLNRYVYLIVTPRKSLAPLWTFRLAGGQVTEEAPVTGYLLHAVVSSTYWPPDCF